MKRYRSRLCVALFLCALSCTQVEAVLEEGPRDVAADFIEAWNARDFQTMWELLPETQQKRWHSGALSFYFRRVMRQGWMEDFNVVLAAFPESVETEDEVPTDYEITYESRATNQSVSFQGRLPVVEIEGDWFVRWKPHLLWPGYARGKRFSVKERWPVRATIFDRRGNRIALGPDDSRRYPHGSVAGTVVGHLEPAPRTEAIDRLVGASGLEFSYDQELAGKPKTTLTLEGDKTILLRLGSKPGRRGRPLRTTLDMNVQAAAQAAFGSTPGGAVVLDPRNGDLLAAVASSPFDPNNYVGVPGIEPFDRALSGLYPPGSALKVLTASTALDTDTFEPSSQLTGPKEYRGVRNFESGEFGTIDFATALKYSVNTAFAQIALKLGAKRLYKYADRFGFNQAPDMRLRSATSSFPKPLDEGDLMWGSIGQAQVVASPLQMATIAATVANDGVRMEPRIDQSAKKSGERAIQKKTAQTMTELMRNVVIGGTGTAANVTGLDVAGKTGTAEVDVAGERKNHAWFICFAPARKPRVAIAVVAEYGGVGGQVAAPLARNILTSVYPHLPKGR